MSRLPESSPEAMDMDAARLRAADASGRQLRQHRELDEDRALLARAGQGDEVAVRKLYRAHVSKLHRHAARILGPSDPDVEDVVQQAFLAALDGAGNFDGRSSVQTWLFGIVTRRALDAARSRFRRQRFSRMLESVGLSSAPSVRPDSAYQTATDVERMLAKLSPMQRVVFVLHDIEGYTFAEISGLTDVGISTLHGRLLSARKTIDAAVGAQVGGDDA
jgi:RNA polymerase sigma-70 factor (ECF subfamily)